MVVVFISVPVGWMGFGEEVVFHFLSEGNKTSDRSNTIILFVMM